MATKRKALSKKTRFDVFKRDKFTCQYCGATPPGVLLHADHVIAVANGGENGMDNLVTACEPCNLGKGAHPLTTVPQSMADKARETAEREEQLLGYQAILNAKRDRIEGETWRVLETLWPGKDNVLSADFASVRMFVERLGLYPTLEAADIARASRAPSHKMFRYFCGVCWSKIREANE